MAAPKQIPITPTVAVDFSVAEASPHVIVYKFWLQAPGSTAWTLIGKGQTNDDISDHFIVTPPVASGTLFAYSLAVGGAANSPWRAQLKVSQPDAPGFGATWEETGVTSDDGGGLGHETRFAQVKLV